MDKKIKSAQCHRVKLGTYQFAAVGNDSEVFPGEYAHAAATVACMDCHQYVTKKEFDTYTVVFGKFKTAKWNVTNLQANGTANVTVWGNTSGSGTTNTDGENWPGNIDNIYIKLVYKIIH